MKGNFSWCGYEWNSLMGGYRKLHPNYPWMWYDPDSISLMPDGVTLRFDILDSPNNIIFDGKEYAPYIGSPTIRSVTPFKPGIFSADIKLPKGINLWSAFWLTGCGNWPPEIDINESWTNEKGSYFRFLNPHLPYVIPNWKVTSNVHYREDDLTKTSIRSRNISICKLLINPSNNFINYKLDWEEDSITWYVNNKLIRKVTGEVPAKLISNLENPDKGYLMNVIFDIWIEEDPKIKEFKLIEPMYVKNFKYECH